MAMYALFSEWGQIRRLGGKRRGKNGKEGRENGGWRNVLYI